MTAKEERVMIGLAAALENFLDYYDQAGIGLCRDNDGSEFDGDEKLNVRVGRRALKAWSRLGAASKPPPTGRAGG